MRLREAQAVYDRYPALKSDGVIYASVAQVVTDLEQQLAQANERARIAAAAYDGQQSSQRELEALYQAATERVERAEGEAEHWRQENAATREAAANAMSEALEMIRPQVAWEAELAAATERAERAENRQRDMVTALLHTYVRLFPTFEFVSYEQALAVIEREWGAVYARLSAPIVCLCGSTRFYDAFQRANYDETMAGRIVLSVGFYPHSVEQAHGEAVGCMVEFRTFLPLIGSIPCRVSIDLQYRSSVVR